jgi:hypothetical protein
MRGFSMLWRIRDCAESNAYGHTCLINDFEYLYLLYSVYLFTGEWEDSACYSEWRSTPKSNADGTTCLINDFEYLVCFIYHVHSLANERIQHVMANEGVRRSQMLMDLLYSVLLWLCTDVLALYWCTCLTLLCTDVLALFCIFILWQMTGFSTLWIIRDYAEVEWWRTHLFDQWLWVLGLLFLLWYFTGEWEDSACYGEWRSTPKSNANGHTRSINHFKYLYLLYSAYSFSGKWQDSACYGE